MKKFIYILLIFHFSSCQKETFNINNLNGNILVMGHGGMGFSNVYPMNTFESIMHCINLGADGTEIDVQMTKDGILVAYHDEELSNKTNKCGLVNDFYWNDLQRAYYTSVPYLNYSILSLEQLFSNIDNIYEHKFIFDCKLYSNNDSLFFYNSFVNSIREIINKYSLQNNVYLESQNTDFLLFMDIANIWGVDYDSALDDDKVRSSIGIAVDWFTVVGPLTFSLAHPLSQSNNDVIESFRFNLGTTF